MLDVIATITLVAVLIFSLVALAAAMPGGLAKRLGFLAIGGLRAGVATVAAASGALLSTGLGPIPPVGIFTVTPLVAAGIAAALSGSFRATVMAMPTRLLIALNTSRILGILFLLLAAEGRLGGPFPYSAGFGDIITGVLALPVAASIAARGTASAARALAWNLFGALDLIVAIALGVTSAPGTPLQLFSTGLAGPLPMQSLPFSLVPTVLVPLYLILHGILYAQLRRRTFDTARLAVGVP